tara:strand:- start:4543 stop:5073 length:531 start_codon:yes stop_codon:yes gene_type:complete
LNKYGATYLSFLHTPKLMKMMSNISKLATLMIVCSFLAGCTDALPDPPSEEFEDETTDSEWLVMTGDFTLVMNNTTNDTLIHAPTIWLDVNTTHGAIELQSFTYNITHLSFEVINNTVRFHNYTWVNMQGYLTQGNNYWSEGFAPEFGNATLHFAAFPFDVTVEYELVYRIWDGRE